MKLTFILEIKLLKEHFLEKHNQFSASDASISNLYQDGNVHKYASNEEPKKKVLTLNSQNKNQEIVTQVTFILEINLKSFFFRIT